MRMRHTATLSLLALGLGIAGTAWLSGQTSNWPGPPQRYVAAGSLRPLHKLASRRHARLATAPPHRPHAYRPMVPVHGVFVRPVPPAPVAVAQRLETTLVPLAMPSAPLPYQAMREHFSGSVVLYLRVDGGGRVQAGSIVQSSGDPLLDAHALASVRGWRFAVPTDRPEGLSGELPMRFDGVERGLASQL